jgi:hypothetical protein
MQGAADNFIVYFNNINAHSSVNTKLISMKLSGIHNNIIFCNYPTMWATIGLTVCRYA